MACSRYVEGDIMLMTMPHSYYLTAPARVDAMVHHLLMTANRSNEQFRWLAATTGISSVLAVGFIVQVGKRVPHWDVLGIWGGITAMFIFRLLGAAWRLLDRKRGPYWVLGPDAKSA